MTTETSSTQYDVNGREIKDGDLLRSHHYTAMRNGRKVYMYKLVFRFNDDLQRDPKGRRQYAVDVADIHRQGSIDKAHKCRVQDVSNWEVIDDAGPGGGETWWERPKRKPVSA